MESQNRRNYRTFNSLDTVWEEVLMKFAYDKSKAQRIINHEGIMLETYAKIIGLIFLPRSVLTVVYRFMLAMRVMYTVKFREMAKKYM